MTATATATSAEDTRSTPPDRMPAAAPPEPPPAGPASPATAGWVRPRLLWALTALVLLGTVVLAGTVGRSWWQTRELAQANDAAVAAGRQLAINFTTVDYRTVDQDTQRVKDGATGDFLTSYNDNLTQLKQLLIDNQSVSKVERSEAALVSGDRDSAVVIVGIVAPTSNTAVPDGEKKTYRMKLGLREVAAAWKVESLEFVG